MTIDIEHSHRPVVASTRMQVCMTCSTPTSSFCKACFAFIRRGANGHSDADIVHVRRAILANPDEAIRRVFVRFDLDWPRPWIEHRGSVVVVNVLLGRDEKTPVQVQAGLVPALVARLANIKIGKGQGQRLRAIRKACEDAAQSGAT